MSVGTGIMRALELKSGMAMVNDVELQEFVVMFRRVDTVLCNTYLGM